MRAAQLPPSGRSKSRRTFQRRHPSPAWDQGPAQTPGGKLPPPPAATPAVGQQGHGAKLGCDPAGLAADTGTMLPGGSQPVMAQLSREAVSKAPLM